MKILFGQSYYLRFDPKLWKAMQPFPPLGTLIAASLMRQQGHTVALFDAMLAESTAEWQAALRLHRPDLAVLFEDNFNYLSKMCLLRMRQAAFTMITMAREQGCRVAVCGSDASDHPADYLAKGADFVILGEGEQTIIELVDHLDNPSAKPLASILGLAWQPSGATAAVPIARTPPRSVIKDLDSLPFPAWDLVDVERYRKIWRRRHGYFAMNMVTTRGCPFHCNWCAKPIWGQRYHTRSPENAAAELLWLHQTYHPDRLWFVDDIFGLQPGWVSRFADILEQNGVRIPFKSLNRVDLLLRPGEIEALRRAGCEMVWVGAESGSQAILDAMEKGTRLDQIEKACCWLHAAGIRVGFFLQFGYPGETRQDIAATQAMVRRCLPDDIGISVSYPLPGTRFYQAVKETIGPQANWIDSADLAMLYRGPFSTAFYRQLHRYVHHDFRLHRAWQLLCRPETAKPAFRSARFPLLGERGHALFDLLVHGLALPYARWKLDRLAASPHQSTPVHLQPLSPLEAAIPTRQPDHE